MQGDVAVAMNILNLDRPAGVFAAVLTLFDEAGAPDSAALALHCRWLLSNGCDGLSVLGTTGEGNSLSVDERIGLLERLFRRHPGAGAAARHRLLRRPGHRPADGASGASGRAGGANGAAVLLQERQRRWSIRGVFRGHRARR